MSEATATIAEEAEEPRRVTWLELFYDLVYVATIIQLGNVLSSNVSPLGFLEFVGLFVPVWWSWMGVTFYATRFLEDNTRHRLLIFVQMFAVTALAINIPTAFEAGISGFALAYVGVRVIVIILFWSVHRISQPAHELARHYAIGFTISALIWLVAAFVPMPLRYGLWALGMLVDLLVPINPATRRRVLQVPPAREHMIERFALFTMIVLGESFVKVIDSLAGEPANAGTFVFGILGMTVACSIWWLYFDHGPESEIKTGKVFTWIYSHLPLLIGITALAVAINKLVLLNLGEPLKMEYRWLFCGTVAICLGAVALINAVSFHPEQHTDYTGLSRMQAISAVGALLIGLIGGMLPALVVVVLVALLCIAQVIISRRIKGRPTLDAAIAG